MANKFVGGFFKFLGLEDTSQGDYGNQGERAAEPAARGRQGDGRPAPPAAYTGRERGYEPAGGFYRSADDGRAPVRKRMDDTPAGEAAIRPVRRNDDMRVIGMPQNTAPMAGGTPMRMVVYQPQSYDDTQRIIDELKANRAIIINLENLKVDVAQRVLDFISGAVYALDGNVRKISRGIFLVAPPNVDISGNFINNLPANFRGTGYFNVPKRD
ncbi:MAG: cell division protein SepF [Eubacteriales bacterium]|nr:cell division protein SepF [Eubacteriales bacterium]